jgi:DNA-binding transcriptional LysR family regulator
MNTVPDFAVFVAVVDEGSFSKAADRLGITKSAVSRRVSQVEERLGIRLLQRTTRKLSLTEAGSRYFAHAREAVHHVRSAERVAAALGQAAIGDVRILAPMSFGTRHVMPHLPALLARHPGLRVDVTLDDLPVDQIDGRFDLALRAGDLPDSTLITRRLAPLHSVICASPDYAREYGFPGKPADIVAHDCVLFSYSDSMDVWEFRSPSGQEKVAVKGRMKVNNSEALSAALIAGGGIGRLPTFIANSAIARGELLRLLPGYDMPAKDLYIQFPDRKLISRAARLLIDALVETFDTEQPYWDRRAAPPEPAPSPISPDR